MLKGEEPEDSADDEDDDGIHDEQPVKDNEAASDMVLLDNCTDGKRERDEEEYSGDQTT